MSSTGATNLTTRPTNAFATYVEAYLEASVGQSNISQPLVPRAGNSTTPGACTDKWPSGIVYKYEAGHGTVQCRCRRCCILKFDSWGQRELCQWYLHRCLWRCDQHRVLALAKFLPTIHKIRGCEPRPLCWRCAPPRYVFDVKFAGVAGILMEKTSPFCWLDRNVVTNWLTHLFAEVGCGTEAFFSLLWNNAFLVALGQCGCSEPKGSQSKDSYEKAFTEKNCFLCTIHGSPCPMYKDSQFKVSRRMEFR